MKKLMPIVLLVLVAACGGSKVAEVEPYATEAPAHYTIRLPGDYDPAESYPVVVALHGYDRSEEQPAALRDAGFFFMPDFILLAVRAPFEAGAGYSWFRDRDGGEDVTAATARQRSARTAEELVMAALEDLEGQYPVEADQRVVMGLGQGASVAAYIALRHHDVFSGLALFGQADAELAASAGMDAARELEVFIAGPGESARRAERLFGGAGARTGLFDLDGPAATAAACRAMQNFFDIAEEDAPEDDLGYDEDGEPVPGERLQPADWGDEPGSGIITQEAPDQARGPQ